MKITQGLFNQMAAANSCELLIGNKAKEIFNIRGEFFICVGSVGNGTGYGWEEISVSKCVHIKSFSGTPVSYSERQNLVNNGKRERGSYAEQWFAWKGNTYVITSDRIRAFPIPEGNQPQLF